MTSVFHFDIKTELVLTEEEGVVSLTKKLNLWQLIKIRWKENVQMSNILFSYESRAGSLAEGTVTASIVDNRISEDLSDNMLRSISFLVTQDVSFSWDYNVNFDVGSLKTGDESPLLLLTNVSGCNMKPGYSLGQIRVRIEMSTSDKMMRKVSKPLKIKLFRDHKMSNTSKMSRRTSVEGLDASTTGSLVITEGTAGTRLALDRSNSAMNIPRQKYYVAAPAKEY
ncbi:Putative movement function [Alphacytorhabdovirus alphapogostemi]|uniref:Movement function n=1 Tax=Patchouli chlorosis-associated cytorhabdovirus TaxID=2979813 RepID=A0A977PLM5_9RHAB|nr:Putative movement function [Patchouli chlorosis-associated cytorhabdovirus]